MQTRLTRHDLLNEKARSATATVTARLGRIDTDTAAVLGTGWGKSVALTESIALGEIDMLFSDLAELSGHARKIGIAMIGGKKVLVLSGRIHMYEGNRDAVYLLMRILWELGIRKLILTSASGGMRDFVLKGDLIVVTDVIPYCATPVDGPPFPIPYGMIRQGLMQSIWRSTPVNGTHIGYLVVNQGPALESAANRARVDQEGVLSIGMSGSAELECFASFVEQECLVAGQDAFVVLVTCVSNALTDAHGHASNTAAMNEEKNLERLKTMLEHTVRLVSEQTLGQ